MGKLPRTEGDKREVRTCPATPSRCHHWEYAALSEEEEVRYMLGGYVGSKSGSYIAPGSGSSAIWPKTLECKIKLRTAECHGPQSCLPVSKGMSLVEGKVEWDFILYEEVFVSYEEGA
jgi:hypothetical protein